MARLAKRTLDTTTPCNSQHYQSLHTEMLGTVWARNGSSSSRFRQRKLGARLRGRTATQRSKKGSGKGSGEGVLRRVLRRGPGVGCTVKKGSEKGSQKGF